MDNWFIAAMVTLGTIAAVLAYGAFGPWPSRNSDAHRFKVLRKKDRDRV